MARRNSKATTLGESLAEDQLFDVTGFIIDYEAGALGEQEVIEGFQHLINSGLCWSLQGHYGRKAAQLIEAGTCRLPQ